MNLKIQLVKNQNVFITSDTHYSHTNICKGVSKWDVSRQKNSVRDFRDLHDMNSTIVNNINAVVGEKDILIHFGDWSFGGVEQVWEFRKFITCQNIFLIRGNHDHHMVSNKVIPNVSAHRDYEGVFVDTPNPNRYGDDRDRMFDVQCQDLFSWVGDYAEFEILYYNPVQNQKARRVKFVASHYPMVSWNRMGAGRMMLHGHVHLPAKNKIHQGRSMDVGVDGNNMKPYNLNEIDALMKKQPIATTSIINDHHLNEG